LIVVVCWWSAGGLLVVWLVVNFRKVAQHPFVDGIFVGCFAGGFFEYFSDWGGI
jgi:hypothetical protein